MHLHALISRVIITSFANVKMSLRFLSLNFNSISLCLRTRKIARNTSEIRSSVRSPAINRSRRHLRVRGLCFMHIVSIWRVVRNATWYTCAHIFVLTEYRRYTEFSTVRTLTQHGRKMIPFFILYFKSNSANSTSARSASTFFPK